jgi:hypothetical protein
VRLSPLASIAHEDVLNEPSRLALQARAHRFAPHRLADDGLDVLVVIAVVTFYIGNQRAGITF